MSAFSYDEEIDCGYINLLDPHHVGVAISKKLYSPGGLIIVDYDTSGEVIGIELINLKEMMKWAHLND